MDTEQLATAADTLLYIQNWYSYDIAVKLFGETMGEHLYEKWLGCEGNILNYLTRLDDVNKAVLLAWGAHY